ncbi:hypothetical protein MTO96_041904 [Rhipicephalus appendiculatus]
MAKAKRIGAKKTSSFNKGTHSLNPDRPKKSNDTTMRDKSTIKRLLMYKNSKPYRDRKGKIVKAAPYQSWVTSGTVARVAPNPKWFGNTRTVSQGALQQFQVELGQAMRDPYQVVMRQSKLPVSLLNEKAKNARVHILDTASYEATFGPKAQRKKPRISVGDLDVVWLHFDGGRKQKITWVLCPRYSFKELLALKINVMPCAVSCLKTIVYL